ncbi:ABC transporter, permease protein [Sulfitobacter noctilucae]|uniref:ABC transporter permease n=1 Tax=Sulfitobacter noctilucae TaxID=1342302 RepID=UPI00046A30AC|nr:ABC transporter permease [Sulfitobacter noctilucae]KIN65687.1 ABC transporter, permease protein [Sulfitobacter noctilucae]
MFQSSRKPKGGIASALSIAELVYHSVVRSVRKQHNNALVALAMNIMQTVLFLGAFYLMFSILGMRGAAVRGDFVIYLMTGIFLYLSHIKALGAVMGADGPASPMMQHAPMNTIIAILSSAMGALYIQVLSLVIVLFTYHVAWTPVEIEQPAQAFGMVLLAWFTGCALGLLLLALKPWFPSIVSLLAMVYQRANMIASGKMFVANTLPGYMLAMFDWNPLFHIIDQARGFAFINYNPRYSNWEYAFWVGVVFIVLGLMGEFYTRRHASLSWNARR